METKISKLQRMVDKLLQLGFNKRTIAKRTGLVYTDLVNALRGQSEAAEQRAIEKISVVFKAELYAILPKEPLNIEQKIELILEAVKEINDKLDILLISDKK